ncbi:MAG: GNAT family N-acetyltransferase [Candidatus Aenigmarchaeota archaeon]|nr:GNAT family N-acetyltransferase [Candidatus Aenigmarchaeota archaeon]
MQIQIREMNEEDVPSVVEIIRRTMLREDVELAKRTLTHYFRSREELTPGYFPKKFYVAVEDGEVIGVSGSYVYDERAWLGWFAVKPEYQGNGIGKALLKKAESDVKDEYERFFVYTGSSKEFAKAREFYKRNGFVEEQLEKYKFDEDTLIFSKELRLDLKI